MNDNDNDNDKGTFIAPYLLRAHRRITYVTTRRENLIKHYTFFMLKCLRNKNVKMFSRVF